MRRRSSLAVCAVLLAGLVPAAAQEDATSLERLLALGLPASSDGLDLHYSPAAGDEARDYAATLTRAVDWFRQQVDWTEPVVMAVLDADDYARVTPVPYPVPHAERATGLVVMPDSIAAFPGFDRWPFDAATLNADLTAHEIGHVIAWQTGIWSSSHWVNELVADVFLAGYLRALKPDDRGLLDGVPVGFEDAGKVTSLAELDLRYSGIGLENYAWFQFRLAALADHMVAGGDFPAVVEALRAAFPQEEAFASSAEPTTAEALRRLEAIRPGVGALAADMAGPSALPLAATAACGPDPEPSDDDGMVVIENHGATPLKVNERQFVRGLVEIDVLFRTELEGEERETEIDRRTDAAMAGDVYARTVEPGMRLHFLNRVGAQLHLIGGDCLTVAAEPSRFDWPGN